MILFQKIKVLEAWYKFDPRLDIEIMLAIMKPNVSDLEFVVIMALLEGVRLNYFDVHLEGDKVFYSLTTKGKRFNDRQIRKHGIRDDRM